ncbi:MAG TPA: substrate-binding domain-containing protein [Hyphomicrobiales bacterium]|nr:substrate-binding domain-containing protein [Hyphomicrobiales bacterium]
MAFGAGGSTASAEEFKIGYSVFWGTNPFLITMIDGAEKAIGEWKEKGVEVELITTNGGDTDPTRQVADVEDLAASGVDGLILFPGDSTVLSEPVKNIYNKNGIPVVVTDIGLTSGETVSFIITDNVLGGRQAAELVAKNVPQGAKVIAFDNAPGAENGQNRIRGFEELAKELGLEVLPRKTLQLSLEAGRRTMEDTLVSIPDIAAVFSQTQVVIQGAAAALDNSPGADVKLVAFDLDPTSYELVKEGKVLGLVVQEPFAMGYEGMNAMLNHLTGGSAPDDRMELPTKVLTQKNAEDFAKDPQVVGAK